MSEVSSHPSTNTMSNLKRKDHPTDGHADQPKRKNHKRSKKDRMPSIAELLDRPWCYYCDRSFEDLNVLMAHQKAKHYKCDRCNRRLNTAGGLQVHLQQVHKEQLTAIENALEGREDPSIEIFGMEGMPDEVYNNHREAVIRDWQKRVAEHTALTGNPPPGTAPNPPVRVYEGREAIQARLREFVAQKEAAAKAEAAKTSVNNDYEDVDDMMASVQQGAVQQPATNGAHAASNGAPAVPAANAPGAQSEAVAVAAAPAAKVAKKEKPTDQIYVEDLKFIHPDLVFAGVTQEQYPEPLALTS